MQQKRALRIVFLGMLGILLGSNTCFAAFSLSVSPYDGSFELRFEESDRFQTTAKKEVTVQVTSDIGKRYQVTQTLLSALASAEGVFLPQDAFTVYTLRGSNARGTLGLDSAMPVGLGTTTLYTSDETGQGDTFTLVYTLHYSLVEQGGLYKGRLSFLLEPIDSTQSPVRATLDIELNIKTSAQVEVSLLSGGNTINLSAPDERGIPAEVTISIKGQPAGQYQIFQQVELPLGPDTEKLLDNVYFSSKGAKNGVLAQTGKTPLTAGRALIYTSNPAAADEQIVLTYGLNAGTTAGRMSGKINYYIESPAQSALIAGIDIEVEVAPVFKLSATPEGRGISFADVVPGQLQEREITIEIDSNLGKPYQVSQRFSSLLTNQQGETISPEAFTLKTAALPGKTVKGTMKYPQDTPVQEGETALFISDAEGEAQTFKIIYQLNVGRHTQIKSGDYSAQVVYSMSAL